MAAVPSSTPVGIKYYKCKNDGFGIIIYPQLRDSSDPQTKIVWDGRNMKDFKYMITVCMPFLGSDLMFGCFLTAIRR
jgi:hypothetical protein